MEANKLNITIDKVKRAWCDVTVHGKRDLKTQVRKDSVKELPVSTEITVYGEVKWTQNRYGSKSELIVYTEDDLNGMIKAKAEACMDVIRKKAETENYFYKTKASKLHDLGVFDYDEELKKIETEVNIRKWIGYFRENYNDGEGYIYENAVTKLHSFGCHDYDSEIEAARRKIIENKEAARIKKLEEEKAMGVVRLKLPADGYGFSGRPKKDQLLYENGSVYRVISSYYHDADGWSIGVLSESWYAVKAIDVSTSEEGKALIQQREEEKETQRRRTLYKNNLDELERKIRNKGSRYCSDKEIYLKDVPGEEIYDSFNIYGGGEIIRVTESTVYLIENNGRDGDCWDLNNIITWGAGAYAFEVPRQIVETELEAFNEAEKMIGEEAFVNIDKSFETSKTSHIELCQYSGAVI